MRSRRTIAKIKLQFLFIIIKFFLYVNIIRNYIHTYISPSLTFELKLTIECENANATVRSTFDNEALLNEITRSEGIDLYQSIFLLIIIDDQRLNKPGASFGEANFRRK